MSTNAVRLKVLLAGLCSQLVCVGIARFAYTPLLPVMQEQTWLGDATGGWLATVNYMGYMVGALIAASVGNLKAKDALYRLALIVAVLTTLGMSFTDNMVVWLVLRFLSGLSSAGAMLIAAGLILNWLLRHHFRSELGLHFAGIGLGIALAAVAVEGMLWFDLRWDQQWGWLAAMAAVLAIPAWVWLPPPDTSAVTRTGEALVDRPPSQRFQRILLAGYFCAGYGYVVSATFIVAIVERQPALSGLGSMTFLIVGLAAAMAVMLWDRVARRMGVFGALILAYGLQVFGIVLPVFFENLWTVLGSALIFGATFVGCVSLVLTMAGRFYPTKPAKLMGKMTLAYGAAQIIAPALTGTLAEITGTYNGGLLMAGGFVTVGTGLMVWLWREERCGCVH